MNYTNPDAAKWGYPSEPGYKEKSGASQDAAEAIKPRAALMRYRVLEAYKKHREMTADECAGKMGYGILSIRPRVSELFAAGKLEKTDKRRDRKTVYRVTA